MPLLVGRVSSGEGDFARWMTLMHEHYRRKTGLGLYPGTLNVVLDHPYHVPAGCLRLEPHEYGGTVGVNLVSCRVFGRRAFILRTDANERGTGSHPPEVIEVATDVKLRDMFGLRDDDRVTVEVED